jgi:hypothetical protein
MASVYLDTSFISACVTTRTDVASAHRRKTSLEWLRSQSQDYRIVVSAEVENELDKPSYPDRAQALAVLHQYPMLAITPEVAGIAAILVRERVMPGPVKGDPIHVAVCCAHSVGYLLSWNVHHLANPRKVTHLRTICMRAGVTPPEIVTPDLLWQRPPRH